MSAMSRKLLPAALALAAALLLAACGFQLRGAANLPYETLFVNAPPTSPFAVEFKRAVRSGSNTRVVDTPKEAQATFHLLSETREKVILSLSAGGRVREYQLRYHMAYRVAGKDNRELRAPTQIALYRDLSYRDEDALSKESEEALLYRDMQSDAVSQLMRQLQAMRPAQ